MQGVVPEKPRRQGSLLGGGFFPCRAEKRGRSVRGEAECRPRSLSAPREEKALLGWGDRPGEAMEVLP